MQLPKDRCKEIISVVIKTFKKYNIRNIPIDCFEIAIKMDIILKPYSSLTPDGKRKAMEISQDGFYMLTKEKVGIFTCMQKYIFYNENRPEKRVRFTIMHEIGHVVLDHAEASDLAESEANFFAKYALAPPPLVHEKKPEDYLELAESFDLSNECASYSFNYYKKWLMYGGKNYRKEEIDLLNQFEENIYVQ